MFEVEVVELLFLSLWDFLKILIFIYIVLIIILKNFNQDNIKFMKVNKT